MRFVIGKNRNPDESIQVVDFGMRQNGMFETPCNGFNKYNT